MLDDESLSAAQRAALAAYADIDDPGKLDDAALLEAVAERIGMTGEMSIDPDGVVELVRDDVLVALESVADEDRDLVEHPDQLQLAVFLRASSAAARADLERSGLIEPAGEDDEHDEWAFAPWGALCTSLPAGTDLPRQMEVLEQALSAAEHVIETGDTDEFDRRLSGLQHDQD